VTGRLIGVGTGPGDPELLTLKAVRAIERADVVAYFAKAGNTSNALAVVADLLRQGQVELPLLYPVTTEIHRHHDDYKATITGFYDTSAAAVAAHLEAGRNVVVLSEGDPLFYGSYMHLHVRLAPRFANEVVPGISAMSGCWSVAGVPIAQGDDVLTVLPGTLDEAELQRRLTDSEAVVIMKLGRNLAKVRRAIAAAGRMAEAVYVARGTTAQQAVVPLAEKLDDAAPYFSLILVPGWTGK
jgi:precorrin-2/cobalt-factor-2 C20-methyltransferase